MSTVASCRLSKRQPLRKFVAASCVERRDPTALCRGSRVEDDRADPGAPAPVGHRLAVRGSVAVLVAGDGRPGASFDEEEPDVSTTRSASMGEGSTTVAGHSLVNSSAVLKQLERAVVLGRGLELEVELRQGVWGDEAMAPHRDASSPAWASYGGDRGPPGLRHAEGARNACWVDPASRRGGAPLGGLPVGGVPDLAGRGVGNGVDGHAASPGPADLHRLRVDLVAHLDPLAQAAGRNRVAHATPLDLGDATCTRRAST